MTSLSYLGYLRIMLKLSAFCGGKKSLTSKSMYKIHLQTGNTLYMPHPEVKLIICRKISSESVNFKG